MPTSIRHPIVNRIAQVERTGAMKADRSAHRTYQFGELLVQVAVSRMRCRCHVIIALPDLVVGIEALGVAPGD